MNWFVAVENKFYLARNFSDFKCFFEAREDVIVLPDKKIRIFETFPSFKIFKLRGKLTRADVNIKLNWKEAS